MIDYIVQPCSRQDLRNYALQIRRNLHLENECYFPVVEFLEMMPELFPPFTYKILEDSDTELPRGVHADIDIVNHCMRIKESVYDKACAGKGRDRFTIAHEHGHYLTLVVSGFKLQRNFDKKELKPYEKPEWHANAFAAEVLMPFHLVKDMSPKEIAKACGVSRQAAEIQYRIIRNTSRASRSASRLL